MKEPVSGTVLLTLVWLTFAAPLDAQQSGPGSPPSGKAAKSRAFSGRVIDGLGRPVAGVKIMVSSGRQKNERITKTIAQTGEDGRYAGILATEDDEWLAFEKEGYLSLSTSAGPGVLLEMYRKVDWGEAQEFLVLDGDKLDSGVREFLASGEWGHLDGELPTFLFKNQDKLRPALRRLIRDPHVGASARDWLDLLDDPGDRDLFPKGGNYTPKKEVRDTDLVEALKATARQRNFFSSAPEPMIDIDFIAFDEELDRALIQCGINRVAMTGITWQFVFRKVGKQWELRSAKEAGRS